MSCVFDFEIFQKVAELRFKQIIHSGAVKIHLPSIFRFELTFFEFNDNGTV